MTENADTVIFKSTSKGLVVDTVINSHDSVMIMADHHTTIIIPDKTTEDALSQNKFLDTFSSWAIIIGAFAALIGAIAAFWQLFKKDKIKEKQIFQLAEQTIELANHTKELANHTKELERQSEEIKKQTYEFKEQTRINQKRLRMSVKPRLFFRGGGYSFDKIQIDIGNRGELAYCDRYEILEGDDVKFEKWEDPKTLPKDGKISISAPIKEQSPTTIKFRIKIYYHDQEMFKYETVYDWIGGKYTFVEEIEIEKEIEEKDN